LDEGLWQKLWAARSAWNDALRDHYPAHRLAIGDFYPWASQEELIDAVLDHPATGRATIASLRANRGRMAMKVSHIAYPSRRFHTPSGKIEFYSERAKEAGLPPLPVHEVRHPPLVPTVDDYPLTLCQGRTLMQFHAFYDHGQALPMLAARDSGPQLWISPDDAARRELAEGSVFTTTAAHSSRKRILPPRYQRVSFGFATAALA
jgi:anaerobic selenocysteine-containing dehydrogenase